MCIEFPLDEIETDFGPLADPALILPVKSRRGYIRFRFLLDTGADCSMMPRSAAEQLGVDLDGVPEILVTGIGGSEIRALSGEITLKIGEADLGIPCVFSSGDTTPYLLGRMGLFPHYNILFDNREKKIVLERIK